MERIKFTSIDSFTKVYDTIKGRYQFDGVDEQGKPVYDESKPLPSIDYKGTVKLHGTCAGISLQNDELVTLSKERIITPHQDNGGFSHWVHSKPKHVWKKLFALIQQKLDSPVPATTPITIFGEWCGKGIQHKTAIADCEPLFVIFGVRIGNETDNGEKAIGWMDMSLLQHDLVVEQERIFNAEMFETFHVTLDWANPDRGQNVIEQSTQAISQSCPVAEYLGVEGGGEGIVWTPIDPELLNNPRFWFKTKGTELQQTKKSKDSDLNAQELESIQELVDEFMTLNRLERGMSYFDEAGIDKTVANTRTFIDFIVDDIFKDAESQVEALNVSRQSLSKALSKEAGKWFNQNRQMY